MLATSRRHAILEQIRVRRAVSVAELAQELHVSAATIRRDLDSLGAEGRLLRVHGGGEAVDIEPDGAFDAVARRNAGLKEAIAARAAGLVADDQIVLLDNGTTTVRLASHLLGKRITVITSSLEAMRLLEADEAITVILVGGIVQRSYHALVGPLTEAALAQIRADVCFLSAAGVAGNGDLLDYASTDVPLKKAMIGSSAKIVLMADSSKFPGSGLFRSGSAADVDVLVTNRGADAQTLDRFIRAGVEVITV